MRFGFAFAALLVASVSAQRTGVFDQSINHPAIKYSTSDSNTVVDALNRRLRDGSAKLVHEGKSGYLRSVLQLLDIPVESQVLVYTQTSLQAQHITMDNPRAIYFNDAAAVAFVRGGPLLEIVAQDPVLGSIFYTINQDGPGTQTFGRDQQCLRCHLSWDTLGVPGMSILSTFPRANEREYANGFFVDHYRPIRERWGGWYVTGARVPPRHMGNLPLILPKPPAAPPGGRVSLEGQFDLTGYLTPYSDIVALMVLEHQVHFTNLVTRATWEARLGDPMRVAEAAETIADYLLFVDEAPITEGPIAGSSGFAESFVSRGKKDAKGRSLRELDLNTRLQKYPLSYMIYSPQFQALPEAPKNLVMARINGVLAGEITAAKYAHLTPALRLAIREILAR
ncbi:MAG TPA: hypothetical protein VJ691_10290 [Vicinamibacterales bacterium]|nr:hypothetical protein [Vicinamibacterales bacterium]